MKHFLYLFLSIWILLLACNDPILVGSNLLEGETLDVEFTDDLAITAKTIYGEPSITYRKLSRDAYSAPTYMIGSMDDATFGKSEAITYFSPIMRGAYPSFSEHLLDSVVLEIPFDSLGFYGDIDAIHNLELRAISESLLLRIDEAPVDTLLSDLAIGVEPDLLASVSRVINFRDSTSIKPHTDIDTTINISPRLRMELDKQFWIDLAGSATDTLTGEDFELAVPGFELRSAPSTSSMFALDLLYSTSSTRASINLYYTIGDSAKVVYQLPLGRYRHSQFTNDYSGSELESSIDNATFDLMYVQSQAGTSIEVDLSEARTLNDRILNYAELIVTVMPEDEDLYPPVAAILPWYRNESGELELAGQSAFNPSLNESYSGGSRTLSYALDLTFHLNQIKKGEISNDKIILIPASKAQRPNRSIILGTNHSEHPLRLNVILTKP